MNTKLHRFLAIGAICAIGAGGAGCAKPVSALPAQSWPAATYTGPLATTTVFDQGTITLAPPAMNTTAAVSWTDAYENSCQTGDAICDPSQSPTIFLADATVTGAGETQTDGSLAPIAKDTLVYVIQFTNVACRHSGPSWPQASQTGSAAGSTSVDACTAINLVDAGSGKVLYSVQGPDL